MKHSLLNRLRHPLLIKSLAFFFAFIFFPAVLFAQSGGNGPSTQGSGGTGPAASNPNPISITIPNPLGSNGSGTIWDFMNKIINNIVLPLGGVLAVLYIMYAGFLMVTAQGDEGKIKTARGAFFNAAVGTGILLGAWVIANVVATTICSLKGGTMSGSICSL